MGISLPGSAKDRRLKWSKLLNSVGTDKTSVAENPRGLIVSNKRLEISGGSIAGEKVASDGMICGSKQTVKNLIMKSNYGELTVVREGLWIPMSSSMSVRWSAELTPKASSKRFIESFSVFNLLTN